MYDEKQAEQELIEGIKECKENNKGVIDCGLCLVHDICDKVTLD